MREITKKSMVASWTIPTGLVIGWLLFGGTDTEIFAMCYGAIVGIWGMWFISR
jgi:hypothetical protein